jgi:hypothetical protein
MGRAIARKERNLTRARMDRAKKAGAKLKMDPDTGTPDHFTAAQRRKKGLDEAANSVHVKTYDSQGNKQMNSPEFKKHVSAHGGEMDYVSDKGAAFKFKSASNAAMFHRGVQSKFKELDSEHDMHEGADSKKYPREGFPKEGDYGYHPNPGMKPQESDSDEDMDVAYKKATEQEARKPLNAKIVEHDNCGTPECCGQCDAEEVEQVGESYNNYRKSGKDPFAQRKQYIAMDRAEKKGVMPGSATSTADAIAAFKAKGGKTTKLDTKGNMKEAAAYQPSAAYQASRNANPYAKQHQDSIDRRNASIKRSRDAVAERLRKKAEELRSGLKTVKEELEEAYGMWKVDFPKQHAGKAVAAGSVHVKAQNTAHAHKVAAKRVGVDHKMFKSKVTKSNILPEELGKSNEWGTDALRQKYAAATPGQEGLAAKKIPTFDPRYDDVPTEYCGGIKEALDNNHPIVKEYNALKKHDIKTLRGMISQSGGVVDTSGFKSKDHAASHIIRSKHGNKKVDAAFGFAEALLSEISAKGAIARQDFRAKIQKVLSDPKAIAKAKKNVAKKKAAEADVPKNLVHQLHKSQSINAKVKFYDGKEHEIAPNHHDKFMNKYHGLKSSIEKESLVKRAHKSHDDFLKAIHEQFADFSQEKPNTDSISPANYPTPPVRDDMMDYNSDDRHDEYDMVAIENDVTAEIENAEWADLVDYYDYEDLNYEDSDEDIAEGITPQGRLKKRFNMMRTKGRRNLARNMALKRVATPDRIKSRSVRAARNMVYSRVLRGRDRSSLSASEKTRLEGMVKRMAPMVGRLSLRLQQKERMIDRKRINNRNKRKKK